MSATASSSWTTDASSRRGGRETSSPTRETSGRAGSSAGRCYWIMHWRVSLSKKEDLSEEVPNRNRRRGARGRGLHGFERRGALERVRSGKGRRGKQAACAAEPSRAEKALEDRSQVRLPTVRLHQ